MGSRGQSATNKIPTANELLSVAKAAKGKALDRLIRDLESTGWWYREDKREKRRFVEEVISNNYGKGDEESDHEIRRAVYGLTPSEEVRRFKKKR